MAEQAATGERVTARVSKVSAARSCRHWMPALVGLADSERCVDSAAHPKRRAAEDGAAAPSVAATSAQRAAPHPFTRTGLAEFGRREQTGRK